MVLAEVKKNKIYKFNKSQISELIELGFFSESRQPDYRNVSSGQEVIRLGYEWLRMDEGAIHYATRTGYDPQRKIGGAAKYFHTYVRYI